MKESTFVVPPAAPRRAVLLGACLGCWRAWWAPRTWPVRTWSQSWRKWRTTSLVGYKIPPLLSRSVSIAFAFANTSIFSQECSSGNIGPALWLRSQKTGGQSYGHLYQWVYFQSPSPLIPTCVCVNTSPVSGAFAAVASTVKLALQDSLVQILQPKRRVDILRDVMEAQSQRRPFVITFCGVNGVGKSTNLAKVTRLLSATATSHAILKTHTYPHTDNTLNYFFFFGGGLLLLLLLLLDPFFQVITFKIWIQINVNMWVCNKSLNAAVF